MTENNTIFNKEQSNPELTKEILSLGHLRIYLQLKYVSLRVAGQAANLSYSRIKQIVTGKYLPSTPELIKNMALAWSIEPVKLAQLFERCKE